MLSNGRKAIAFSVFTLFGVLFITTWSSAIANGQITLNTSQTEQQQSSSSFFSPTHRAIILHNGDEEILFLSTDLAGPFEKEIVEYMWLPSGSVTPISTIGNLETFTKLAELAKSKKADLNKLIGFSPTGVLSILSTPYFDSTDDFLKYYNSLRPPTSKALDRSTMCAKEATKYQTMGFKHALFDAIRVKKELQTFLPTETRFSSKNIFYPISLAAGVYDNTKIELVFITRNELTSYSETGLPIKKLDSFTLNAKELSELSPSWTSFMNSPTVHVQHVEIIGLSPKALNGKEVKDLFVH